MGEWLQAISFFQKGDKAAGHEEIDRLRRQNLGLALNVEGWVAYAGYEGLPDDDAALSKFEGAIKAGDRYVWGAAMILRERGEWRRFFEQLELGARRGDPDSTEELAYWTEYGKSDGKGILVAPDHARTERLDAVAAASGHSVGLLNYAVDLRYHSDPGLTTSAHVT